MHISKKKLKLVLKIGGLLCFALFVLFSILVTRGYFLEVDRFVNESLYTNRNRFVFLYSKILEYLYIFLLVLCARMFYKFYRRGEKLEALLLGITGFLSLFAQFFLKPYFDILCPGSYYNSVFSTYKLVANNRLFQKIALEETCYPSNHTIGYIVTCGYLALLVKTYFPRRKETNLITGTLIFIGATVGFTRLYLHVHWLSDVIAAYFLGGALLCVIFWTRLHRREFKDFLKVMYEKLGKNSTK